MTNVLRIPAADGGKGLSLQRDGENIIVTLPIVTATGKRTQEYVHFTIGPEDVDRIWQWISGVLA